MLKQVPSEQLVDEMAARNVAKIHCDQALVNAIKKLLAKGTKINQDAPAFCAEFSAELFKIGKSVYTKSPYLVSRYIAGGLMVEASHGGIEPFSIIITAEQIAKEICWQQHPASKKGTYL